jgi:virginiamycin B lyase
VTEYALPAATSEPLSISVGSDGALWFTQIVESTNTGKIGRITTGGVISEYADAMEPADITPASDGALWFAEANLSSAQAGGCIGRITTSGAMSAYAIPTQNSAPWGIATGRDAALWFTELNGNKIGRLALP